MVPLVEALLAGGARIHDDDREQLHATQRSALPALVADGMTVDLWVRNVYGGTALGTLRWAIENRPEPRPDADAIIAALVAAGAT
jgi:hypothetical protein